MASPSPNPNPKPNPRPNPDPNPNPSPNPHPSPSPSPSPNQVLEFLGLDYSLLPAGPTHDCVVGKAGIMDEAADAGKKDSGGKGIVVNKAGVFGTGRGLGIAGAGSDAATKSIAIG